MHTWIVELGLQGKEQNVLGLRASCLPLFYLQAHLHHYLHVEGMEQGCFTQAISSLSSLIEEYSQLDATKHMLTPDAPRLTIAT